MKRPRVFISYAHGDGDAAHNLIDLLSSGGLDAEHEAKEIGPSESISTFVRDSAAASDYVLLLLSPAAMKSRWLESEVREALFKDWRQRDITVVPVKVKPCTVPYDLLTYRAVDLTRNFDLNGRKLAEGLQQATHIDFREMSPPDFERLIADLLRSLGFKNLMREATQRHLHFDMTAKYFAVNPFGKREEQTWIVEVSTRSEKHGLSALREFLGALSLVGDNSRGLFVSSTQLSSTAKDWLSEIRRGGGPGITLLEGSDLKRILLMKPKLVKRYFRS